MNSRCCTGQCQISRCQLLCPIRGRRVPASADGARFGSYELKCPPGARGQVGALLEVAASHSGLHAARARVEALIVCTADADRASARDIARDGKWRSARFPSPYSECPAAGDGEVAPHDQFTRDVRTRWKTERTVTAAELAVAEYRRGRSQRGRVCRSGVSHRLHRSNSDENTAEHSEDCCARGTRNDANRAFVH